MPRTPTHAQLLAFAQRVALLPKDGEAPGRRLENDAAYETLHELITEARSLL